MPRRKRGRGESAEALEVEPATEVEAAASEVGAAASSEVEAAATEVEAAPAMAQKPWWFPYANRVDPRCAITRQEPESPIPR